MPSLLYTIKAKGFNKTISRVNNLVKRYGLSSYKMEQNILNYINLLEEYNAKATFPITATTLEKHTDFIRSIDYSKLEFAVHGYKHVDYTTLSAQSQREHVKKSIDIFNENGIKVWGFRGPYLQANDITLRTLKENDLLYDSSCSIHWDVVPTNCLAKNANSYDLALQFYKPEMENGIISTRSLDGLVRIPVSLPDDEMLIDRLDIRDQKKIGDIWLKIVQKIGKSGGLFVLQLHPERFPLASNALRMLLNKANSTDNISILSLKDLALMSKENMDNENPNAIICITGDIDIISIQDFR